MPTFRQVKIIPNKIHVREINRVTDTTIQSHIKMQSTETVVITQDSTHAPKNDSGSGIALPPDIELGHYRKDAPHPDFTIHLKAKNED